MRYLLLAVGLAMLGCATPDKPPGQAAPLPVPPPLVPADVFAAYLHDSFSDSIPRRGEAWYVVIPAVGCLGCAHAELRALAATAWAPNVTVVTSGLLRDLTAAERRNLARHAHLLADTLRVADNTLDRLNLPFSTLTGLVCTRNGRAVEFRPFDVDTYRQVFATLPRRNQ